MPASSPELLPPSTPPSAIAALLGQLRRRIRGYVWLQGLAMVSAVLGLWFWASLAFDWVFEPPVELRVALLALLAAVLGYAVYRAILRRVFVPLADRSLALLVERRFPDLHESLLTTVELSESPRHAAAFNRQMLAHTYQDAEQGTRTLNLGSILNRRPLVRTLALAALLLASIAAFAVTATPALGIWARRSLLLSPELWPRYTRLVVDGFDSAGRLKIARGSDVELLVEADAGRDRVVPETVEVRYVTEDGARGRERLTRSGVAVPGRDEFQQYTCKFKSVLANRQLWILGGDDRLGPFYLDVVDSPTLTSTTLHCVYPAYMHRAPRDLAISGLMQLPRGTQVTIHAEANKPLTTVQWDVVSPDAPPQTHKRDLVAETGRPQSRFTFELPVLDSDKTLLCTLLDADGIRSRDPVRLSLGAVPDEAPQVSVQLEGISTAITSTARLPAVGEITDDYGVAQTWFDIHVDDGPPRRQPLAVGPLGRDKLPVQESLEVGSLELKPKQKLHFAVQAADTYALGDAPNVGSSQRYVLDVVTPEQLRAMLEARELMLRRRFETMVAEFTETRDLLARLELPASQPSAGQPANKDSANKQPVKPEPGQDKAATAKAAEPGDAPAAADTQSPEQRLVGQRVHAERVLQNTQRAAHETLEVAASFDGIRAELVNNRVDTEELKSRLKDGIADPLRRIVAERFPGLESQLRDLQARLADPVAAGPLQVAALAQADKILVEMKQVLDRMLELETFNEVLDMLRSVIVAQEKLNEATKTQQKQKAKALLNED